MENLGIICEIILGELQQILEELFSGLNFHYWQMEKENPVPEDAILFSLIHNESEFPVRLSLYRFSDDNIEEREQFIAK